MTSAAREDPGPGSTPAGAGDGARPDAGRHQFVLGVFAAPAGARIAIDSLGTSGAQNCPVLLISGRSRDGQPAPPAGVECLDVDRSRALDAAALRALSARSPFAALWDGSPSSRLGRELAHHLAQGADVVVVRTQTPEQQLSASRTLLQARCEVLLTHDAAIEQVVTADNSCCGAACPGTCRDKNERLAGRTQP